MSQIEDGSGGAPPGDPGLLFHFDPTTGEKLLPLSEFQTMFKELEGMYRTLAEMQRESEEMRKRLVEIMTLATLPLERRGRAAGQAGPQQAIVAPDSPK